MHLSRDPDDRRELDRLVADLQRDTPPRLVLGALVDAAKRLHLKLEGDGPTARPASRGRAT